MDKIIERIIERVPDGLALQIQTLGNEIFDLNDVIDKLQKENYKLKKDIKDRDGYIMNLERMVVDLKRELNRALSDFNQSESKYFKTAKRLEEALKIA
jgi:predicted  nucleic acid-binding Zn-ribbon protein